MEIAVDKYPCIEIGHFLRQAKTEEELNALVSTLPFYAWNCEHEVIYDMEAFVTESGRIGICGTVNGELKVLSFHNVKFQTPNP